MPFDDDDPALLPVGQAHGQNNFLLGKGSWTLALRISDDGAPPLADLEYVELDVPPPPRDQGLFSPFLVPGGIRAKARVLRAPPFSATRI